MVKKMAKKTLNISKHILVPKHSKTSDKEKKELFEKHNIILENLPAIFKSDSAIAELEVEEDDVIKIERKSPTAGTTIFYRRVING